MPRRFILASASPRRRELLGLLRIPFEVVTSNVVEVVDPGLSPKRVAENLAGDKALEVFARMGPECLVLGADTVVAIGEGNEGCLLGKPTDGEDARRMLRMLSGRTHMVYTGIALAGAGTAERSVEATEVTFRVLSDEMIDAYVATGEPMDKAGAYGIQGYAAPFIGSIGGDYFNVVGLPIHAVSQLLERAGVAWWKGPEALDGPDKQDEQEKVVLEMPEEAL
jgi:septum formation protein